jgi:hypothetical protein
LSNPEALKKAQMEIDAVVGRDQLPDFGDEDSLPYITAIVREGMRWIDVVPLGKYDVCLDTPPADML